MKNTWLNRNRNKNLIVFFNGWACDEKPFINLDFEDNDLLMFYDYSEHNSINETLIAEINQYQNINLIAWSMGVFIANNVFQSLDVSFKTKIAINGTLNPIDDMQGIPKLIYDGTLQNFSESTRKKFFLRMCGDKNTFVQFLKNQPTRNINNQKEELTNIQKNVSLFESNAKNIFNKLILGNQDRIFPVQNQCNFWNGKLIYKTVDIPHFPFFVWKKWNDIFKI